MPKQPEMMEEAEESDLSAEVPKMNARRKKRRI
jgi:hypothetical protein